MLEKFLEYLRESVIVQAVITVAVIVTVCYLYATSQTVPSELLSILYVVIGFYFGSKVQYLTTRRS